MTVRNVALSTEASLRPAQTREIHGLVDYILGADAIFVLFWLLCGLAVTVRTAQRGKKTQPC
jgi:hypothetical protein